VLLLFWITLKLIRRPGRWWIKLDDKAANFQGVIGNLERLTYLRDEDDDENELGQVRSRSDSESRPYPAENLPTSASGVFDMPGIGAQLSTPITPSPNGLGSPPSHEIGNGTLQRRETGESETEIDTGDGRETAPL
jgi:hypothetical protein